MSGGGCRCDGGQPKNFLRPCVLLLLAEQSAHGYDLLERLRAFGFSRDPGGVYRVLRSLDAEGLVASRWETSEVGPARCLYRLTPLGRDWLSAWADTLDETRRTIETYLLRFNAVIEGESGAPDDAGDAAPPERQAASAVDDPRFRTLASRSDTP